MELKRRDFLKHAAAAAALGGMMPALFSAEDPPGAGKDHKPRPNIVLIMADDLGYEAIGANGSISQPTPVLDGLAANGMRFRNGWSQPICTPSRVQIMTGQYNVRNYTRFGHLDRGQVTFAHCLKRAGYATAIAGKWQLGREEDSMRHFGFDEWCTWHCFGSGGRYANPGRNLNGELKKFPGRFGDDVDCDFACDFIGRHKDRPFLLYWPMCLTHKPFVPTPDSADWGENRGGQGEATAERHFREMVTYMDKVVGKLVAHLETLGLRERTLILFTGDNGTEGIKSMIGGRMVGTGKGNITRSQAPLIASWPGTMPRGKVCDDVVDFSDFLPTLCAAAGAEAPQDRPIDGVSFLPQLRGEAGTPREWSYCWYSRDGGPTGKELVRDRDYYWTGGKLVKVDLDFRGDGGPIGQPDADQQRVLDKFKAVNARFADARPPEFATANRKKGGER